MLGQGYNIAILIFQTGRHNPFLYVLSPGHGNPLPVATEELVLATHVQVHPPAAFWTGVVDICPKVCSENDAVTLRCQGKPVE